MRRHLILILLTLAMTLVGGAALSAEAPPASPSQAWVFWAAVIGPLTSTIALLATVLRVGRWLQRTESSASTLADKLAVCRQQCEVQFAEIRAHGSDYAHAGLRDVRAELKAEVQRLAAEHARKDAVEREYQQLRELMQAQHEAVCGRLDKIERSLEQPR